jgi:hypothetical protein
VPLFYRIVKNNPPTSADFESHAAQGRVLPADAPPELAESWAKVSAYDSEGHARRMAVRRRGRLGQFIAVLEIPHNSGIDWKRTGGEGHYDLDGGPSDLLARVTTVVPV